MSTVPYIHHDRHSMRSYNGLYPGRTTPRSTSPYSSQIDLADVQPDHFTETLAIPGPSASVCSVASTKGADWETSVLPPDVEVIKPGEEDVVPFAPCDVSTLKYYRTEYL